MSELKANRRPVLVLDFDGAVCLGEGPVWAYARAVGQHLPPEAAAHLDAELAAFLAGQRPQSGWGDGYAVVFSLGAAGLTTEQANAAYRCSRDWLADHPEEVRTPPGLHELLAKLNCTRVLVTNSPTPSSAAALANLGLSEVIDEVIGGADKPDGFALIITRLLDGQRPESLLSVGDFWANDIAPVLRRGGLTAWLNPYRQEARPANLTATTMDELYPALQQWCFDPIGFATAHPVHLADDGSDASIVTTNHVATGPATVDPPTAKKLP